MFHRKLRSTDLDENQAAVVVCARVLWLQAKDVRIVLPGRLKVLLLVGDHAEQENGVCALLLLQNPLTRFPRALQAAVAVMLLRHVGQRGDVVVRGAGVFGH